MSKKMLGHNYWYDLVYFKDDLAANLLPQLKQYVGVAVTQEVLAKIKAKVQDYLEDSDAGLLFFDLIANVVSKDATNEIISVDVIVVDSE